MKEHFKDKSNSQILNEMQEMKQSFEAVKARMLKDYDLLETIEKKYNEANLELVNRLKGKQK